MRFSTAPNFINIKFNINGNGNGRILIAIKKKQIKTNFPLKIK